MFKHPLEFAWVENRKLLTAHVIQTINQLKKVLGMESILRKKTGHNGE